MFQTICLLLAQSEKVQDKPYTPITLEQGVIWVAVIASLIAIGFYVVNFFRGNALHESVEPASHLEEFRRLRDEGMIDDEEFKQVKTSIASEPVEETPQQIEFHEDKTDQAKNDD